MLSFRVLPHRNIMLQTYDMMFLFLCEEVGGAYCFWGVHPSVLLSVCPLRPFVTLFYAKHNFRTVHATVPASVAQLDASSDWRPGGRGFNPR